MRSRVELFEQIRRDRRDQGLSVRALASRHGVHRRAVRQALDSAVPPARKEYPRRRSPAMDPWAAVVDGWLLADREAPRKQRHTARRVWQRLVAEHGAVVSEVTVSRYVARRRRELGVAHRDLVLGDPFAAGGVGEVRHSVGAHALGVGNQPVLRRRGASPGGSSAAAGRDQRDDRRRDEFAGTHEGSLPFNR